LPAERRPIYETCMALDSFSQTHPLKQPDAAPGEH
jgi:hypothetical protein